MANQDKNGGFGNIGKMMIDQYMDALMGMMPALQKDAATPHRAMGPGMATALGGSVKPASKDAGNMDFAKTMLEDKPNAMLEYQRIDPENPMIKAFMQAMGGQ